MSAILESLQKSSINIKSISQTLSDTKKSTSAVNESVGNISRIVATNTRVKRELFARSNILNSRREEASKRQEIEDRLESTRVSTSPQVGLSFTSRSEKGPLGRLLGFLGFTFAGWIVENLPTWIFMGQEFISRINSFGRSMYGMVSSMQNIIKSFGDTLGYSLDSILRLDFDEFAGEGTVARSFEELNLAVKGLGTNITDTFKLFTTPLTESVETGEQAPALDEQRESTMFPGIQQETAGSPTSSPSGGGGGRWKPLLDVISSGEGGYESVNPGQVVPGLTNMTISEAWSTAKKVGRSKGGSGAMGRYQLLSDPIGRARKAGLDPYKDKFTPSNQDKIAVYIIENIRYGKEWLSGRLKGGDAAFAQGIADEWAGIPNLYGQYSYSGQGGKVKASSVKEALSQVKRAPSTPQKPTVAPQTQTPQISPPPSTPVNPMIGDRLGAGRGHGGVDLQVKEGTPLRAISDGIIVDSDYEKKWGNFLVMKDNLGIYHLYGHMQSGYKRGGPVKKGEIIGKVGMTGRTTGPHLHWETGTGWNGGVITGRFDALNKYSKFAPFNTQPSKDGKTETPAQISAQPKPSQPAAMTPERKGSQVMIIDDTQPQAPQASYPSQQQPSATPTISEFKLLNNFIKNKLLLDLAYL
jgi:murein DD-endopeptidase MepM/ murein hydrolase activator NlpD